MRRIRNFIVNNENDIICTIVFIAVLVFMIFLGVRNNNQLNSQLRDIINNPTFIGEVVNKESITRNARPLAAIPSTTFQLHIIGAYMEGDEVIHVDQLFTITHYWYRKFEIGDLIYHSS